MALTQKLSNFSGIAAPDLGDFSKTASLFDKAVGSFSKAGKVFQDRAIEEHTKQGVQNTNDVLNNIHNFSVTEAASLTPDALDRIVAKYNGNVDTAKIGATLRSALTDAQAREKTAFDFQQSQIAQKQANVVNANKPLRDKIAALNAAGEFEKAKAIAAQVDPSLQAEVLNRITAAADKDLESTVARNSNQTTLLNQQKTARLANLQDANKPVLDNINNFVSQGNYEAAQAEIKKLPLELQDDARVSLVKANLAATQASVDQGKANESLRTQRLKTAVRAASAEFGKSFTGPSGGASAPATVTKINNFFKERGFTPKETQSAIEQILIANPGQPVDFVIKRLQRSGTPVKEKQTINELASIYGISQTGARKLYDANNANTGLAASIAANAKQTRDTKEKNNEYRNNTAAFHEQINAIVPHNTNILSAEDQLKAQRSLDNAVAAGLPPVDALDVLRATSHSGIFNALSQSDLETALQKRLLKNAL